jgi:hypothetical protein
VDPRAGLDNVEKRNDEKEMDNKISLESNLWYLKMCILDVQLRIGWSQVHLCIP